MTRTLVVFLMVTLGAALTHAHTDVTTAEVKAMLDAGGNVTAVDVREESEFCDSTYTPPGHIPGATNLPWYAGDLEARYSELPSGDSIIVVCRSGGRSNAAANFLDSVGFTSVFDMLGGMNAWEYETELCWTASVPGLDVAPARLAVGPASPNPFSSETEIVYAVPAGGGVVTLGVYDSRGRLVARLADDNRGAGTHRVAWDGTDSRGRPVSSGVYFYRIQMGSLAETAKLVLSR